MAQIAIIGAGAIGSTIGGLLSRAGHEVTLIGRSAHLKAIAENGLILNGSLGTLIVHPNTAEVLDFRPDFAFLTVKTQDVLSALETNQSHLDGAPLVTFQNGVQSDELVATRLPKDQIISVVVNTGATYLSPGTVTVSYTGSLIVGCPFGAPDSRLETLAGILNAAIPTRVSSNILGAHWLKLIVNLNNALPAITNWTVPQVMADPFLRQLSIRVMREGLQVVNRAGIRLESLADVSVSSIQMIAKLPIPLASLFLASNTRRLKNEWPLLGSTLQSLRRGRPTEIDYLNGEIVRVGRQHNTPTPLNAAIVDMVHQVERTGQYCQTEAIRAFIEKA
ncbi:MAG TPA: 2-dehydropantoate 2-reductase [Anaerolineaceae bacterium]|nr:2-dehydropantoate 2-reductase [Anaerolineaceae bacterium]